jgi:recombination protein RecT
MTQTITETTTSLPVEHALQEAVPGSPIPQGDRSIAPVKPLTIYGEIARHGDKLKLLLQGTGISAEKLIYEFQAAVYNNPKLQNCSIPSLLHALVQCAEMGLMPGFGINIIPYNGIAQTQVSLQGWLTLLWRSGNVGNITHNLHRRGDEFAYRIEQTGTMLCHNPKLEMDGEILGAYAMITLKNNHVQFKYCNRREIDASKEASKSKGSDSPWVKHFDQMAQIVPLRKLARLIAPSLREWGAEEYAVPGQIPLQGTGSSPSLIGAA